MLADRLHAEAERKKALGDASYIHRQAELYELAVEMMNGGDKDDDRRP